MAQEVSSNDDVVGVREYMSDLEDSVSIATETPNTSVEDLNQEQQFADVEELNHESIQSDNQIADAWLDHETRAGRKTKKPALLQDFFIHQLSISLFCT